MFNLFASAKKKHFLKKLSNLQNNIWDKEFQKYQSLEMRESIRLDRDREMEKVDAYQTELKRDHNKETGVRLEAELKLAVENATRYEGQMKMIDAEIEGTPYVSPENQGTQGLNQTIASLHELKKMFKSYVRTL